MQGLHSGALLDAWEAGANATNPARARLLLKAAGAWTDGPDETVGLGEREARLLELHRQTFGEEVRAVVTCPECTARLEIATTVSAVTFDGGGELRGSRPFSAVVGSYEVRGRTCNAADLTAAARWGDADAARMELLGRCVTEAVAGEGAVAVEDLPTDVVEAIGDLVADLDPQAEVRLQLDCACCGHEWAALLDITQFLWREVSSTGERLLDEVDALAAAYGWAERDVLSLSPWRRRTYFDRIARG